MFTKTVSEEIIDDNSIKIISSPNINFLAFKNKEWYNDDCVRVPILYFDDFSNKYSLLERNDIEWNVVRVFDCIKNQVFYFIATQDQVKCKNRIGDHYYDHDMMDFIFSAALGNPRYVINTYISNRVIIKRESSEIVFFVNLETPISKEYMMPRDYRTKLGFLDSVSFLSDYRKELNTMDQEG